MVRCIHVEKRKCGDFILFYLNSPGSIGRISVYMHNTASLQFSLPLLPLPSFQTVRRPQRVSTNKYNTASEAKGIIGKTIFVKKLKSGQRFRTTDADWDSTYVVELKGGSGWKVMGVNPPPPSLALNLTTASSCNYSPPHSWPPVCRCIYWLCRARGTYILSFQRGCDDG